MHTGEEGETQLFKAPMKVYAFDKTEKAWKERGRCIVKLNVTEPPAPKRFEVFSDEVKGRKKKKKSKLSKEKASQATGFKLYEPKKSSSPKPESTTTTSKEDKPNVEAASPNDNDDADKSDSATTTTSEEDVEKEEPEEPKKRARFILRSEGTHNVVLNCYVYKGMPFGHPKGNDRPTGNQVTLITPEGGIWIFKVSFFFFFRLFPRGKEKRGGRGSV